MQLIVFDSRDYDKEFFKKENEKYNFELEFINTTLEENTTRLVTEGAVVCCFIHDNLSRKVLEKLAEKKVKLVALRCAGFNNVDIEAANELGIEIVRVPTYSPYAIAEHAVAMMLSLNRKICKAHSRTKEANFTIEGLLGFDMHGKVAGVIGLGNIGQVTAKILNGFGMQVLGYDPYAPEIENVKKVSLEELLAQADVISLHCPLNDSTHHLINEKRIAQMKSGVMLINTSRGGIIDTQAVIDALKTGKIGYLGLDVYEEEQHIFHQDFSNWIIQDEVLARLLTFPNVLITSHQGFFTHEAISNLAATTFSNIQSFIEGKELVNKVKNKA